MDELRSFPFHTAHHALCSCVLAGMDELRSCLRERERERERETEVREGIRLWIGAGIVQEKEDSSVLVGFFVLAILFSFFFRDFGRLGEEEEEEE